MQLSLDELLNQSVEIAWDYLLKTGELGEPQKAAQFLSSNIDGMVRKGVRSRSFTSNKAIIAYRNLKMSAKPTVIHLV
jgi:hypothetical protein